MSKQFTLSDLSKTAKTDNTVLLSIDNAVYDVTSFVDEHPGGAKILKRMTGKDASKQFWKYHNDAVLKKYGPKFKIGEIKEEAKL